MYILRAHCFAFDEYIKDAYVYLALNWSLTLFTVFQYLALIAPWSKYYYSDNQAVEIWTFSDTRWSLYIQVIFFQRLCTTRKKYMCVCRWTSYTYVYACICILTFGPCDIFTIKEHRLWYLTFILFFLGISSDDVSRSIYKSCCDHYILHAKLFRSCGRFEKKKECDNPRRFLHLG